MRFCVVRISLPCKLAYGDQGPMSIRPSSPGRTLTGVADSAADSWQRRVVWTSAIKVVYNANLMHLVAMASNLLAILLTY